MGFRIVDENDLEGELRRLSNIRFDAVVKKNMTEVYNRGKSEGGTPVSTEATRPGGPHGELKQSLGQRGDEVGYTKDYAPHVEFGHRTVDGGYVQGQRFLKANVDAQRPIFEEDLRKQLRRFLMLRRFSAAALLGCLIDHIERTTGVRCYDAPDDEPSPLYSVQLTRTEPANTKTMFMDSYEVWVHCISEKVVPYSHAPVLKLVQTLEEAMTDEVPIPAPFRLQNQEYLGMQTLKKDESGEGHAALSFRFRVCYGFRCK